jgi:hypothetical protein
MPVKILGPTSKYQAVAQAIRQMVQERGLLPGDRVPPEEEIATRLGVSYLTVRRANEELIREGLIRREQGRGTFVAAQEGRASRALTIGFLGMGRELEGFTLKHFSNLKEHLSGLGRPARLLFDSVIPHSGDNVLPPQFERGGVDVIVTYGVYDAALLKSVASRGVPLVVIGNTVSVPGIAMIEMDLAGLAYQTIRALVRELNFQDVWLVSDPLRTYSSRQILTGYRRAVEEGLIASELLALCDDGNYLPLIRSFSRLWPALKTRQAMMWFPVTPVIPLGLMDFEPKAGEFGVVNYKERTAGWSLPSEFDLGMIPFPWDLYGRLIVAAIAQTQEPGGPQPCVIRPVVEASRDETGAPKLAVRWEV